MYYFVRVNGATLHNNPNEPDFYVQGEPPLYPLTAFNAVDYCLKNKIIRIGWPDTGDLTKPEKTGALANGHRLSSLKPRHQNYLRSFARIKSEDIVLMPDKANPGDIYLGKVVRSYHYFHDIPFAPYEHAHRAEVEWNRDSEGNAIIYQASDLNINTGGGFWNLAFQVLDEIPSGRKAIPYINEKMKSASNRI